MNQEDKCIEGICFHGPEEHEERVCWKITQPILEKEDTIDKFCGCQPNGLIRRFGHRLMGFMPVQEIGDLMITKVCEGCHRPFNLLIGETLCMMCKDRPEYWENEIPTLKEE